MVKDLGKWVWLIIREFSAGVGLTMNGETFEHGSHW